MICKWHYPRRGPKSVKFTKCEIKINNTQENKDPHVPGAKGIFPIGPNEAIKWIGFLGSGNFFIVFKSAHMEYLVFF